MRPTTTHLPWLFSPAASLGGPVAAQANTVPRDFPSAKIPRDRVLQNRVLLQSSL